LPLTAEHRTNREIADALVLSLNPVKSYARQIYGKVGVSCRRQAVPRARELGLLGANDAGWPGWMYMSMSGVADGGARRVCSWNGQHWTSLAWRTGAGHMSPAGNEDAAGF
jgi:hypothetical protein